MIDKLKTNPKLAEFIRFIIVGVLATALHYGIYLALEYGIGLNYNMAYTIGYLLSFIFNFFASTFFTFQSEANAQNGIKFAGAHLINYFVHMFYSTSLSSSVFLEASPQSLSSQSPSSLTSSWCDSP